MKNSESIRTEQPGNDSDPDNQCLDVKLLRSQTDRLAFLALEATSDGIWTWHIPSGETYFSPRYYTMLGYEPDELPAHYDTWASLLHPEDREQAQEIVNKHIENMSASYEIEFRLRMKSGDWLWILGRGRVLERDQQGRPILMAGSHVNIDTRKRAEQKLERYQAQLEQMVRERTEALEQTSSLLEATLDAIPDVLGIQDNQHRIIRYNAAGYRFLNMTHEEVVGKRCFELIGRTRECDNCATSQCYRTLRPASIIRYEAALDAWLDVRAYPILDEDGQLVKVIEHLRDITAEKKAEAENRILHEQLQHAQKMESLGTLAGGIAHDFNNLLMGIQGRASLMALELAPSPAHRQHLQAIQDYVISASGLTRQLLGFARGGKYEVKPFDINELMRDSADMFGRTRKELRIDIATSPGAMVVEADRGQIEQVLLNIYVNAWQAMPDGGQLQLATQKIELTESQCAPHRIDPGCYVQISITDTGIGMDEATCQLIFDPFFTTKEKGRGTGLGLASAYGIIKNHQGMITVSSRLGHGTRFDIYLPLSDKTIRPAHEIEVGWREGRETVLLVDDEQMIIDVGTAMLSKLGYKVIAVKSGAEALEKIRAMGTALDLVVLDLIMPGMDGGKVFAAIQEIQPGLPVLLSSGYALDGQAEAILQKGCRGFIQKPFNLTELSEHVRKALDQR